VIEHVHSDAIVHVGPTKLLNSSQGSDRLQRAENAMIGSNGIHAFSIAWKRECTASSHPARKASAVSFSAAETRKLPESMMLVGRRLPTSSRQCVCRARIVVRQASSSQSKKSTMAGHQDLSALALQKELKLANFDHYFKPASDASLAKAKCAARSLHSWVVVHRARDFFRSIVAPALRRRAFLSQGRSEARYWRRLVHAPGRHGARRGPGKRGSTLLSWASLRSARSGQWRFLALSVADRRARCLDLAFTAG
jgi:hypothetical protein